MKKILLPLGIIVLVVTVLIVFKGDGEEFEDRPFVEGGDLQSPLPGGAIGQSPLPVGRQGVDTRGGSEPQRIAPSDDLRPVEDGEEDLLLAMEDIERMGELFEEIEERWAEKIETLFIQGLNLGPEDIREYYRLRESYDEAKLKAFEDFHERLGQDGSYHMTSYEEEINLPIQQDYEERLRQRLGDSGMRSYIEMRDDYNRQLRLDGRTNLPLFLIDY